MFRSSAWALVSPEVLSGVFKLVPFDSKFACEATCISWRQVLREGFFQKMFLVDKIEPRTVCNDPDFQGSVIVLPSSALCLPSFASWQLTHLELPMSTLPSFPKCLSQLQKLEHLAISGYSVRYTSDVIGLAQLPRSSHLELGERYEEESHDETGNGCPASDMANLELLAKALDSRPLRLVQKHPDSYWNFSVSL